MTPLELFKALSDETRLLGTLLIQREGELCVCELTTALQESQPKVSRHLAQLRSQGLLADRRQGQWVFYKLHPDLPEWVVDLIERAGVHAGEQLDAAFERLERMEARPSSASGVCGSSC